MYTIIQDKLTTVALNKSQIKTLKAENEVLLSDVIKEILQEVKSLNSDSKFSLFTKRQKLDYLKIKNSISTPFYGVCCEYLILDIHISLNSVTSSLFRDLVNLTKNGYIAKSAFKSGLVRGDYLSLRKLGNEQRESAK